MKKIAYKIYEQIKNLLRMTGYLFWWIVPFALFLLATFLPRVIWNISFNDYLEFLKILVWPISALIILFFFKKVITYLFFSIDGFNFFGAKGELKNVYDLITEKVNEKLEEEKRQRQGDTEKQKLLDEVRNKTIQKETVEKVIKLWTNSTEENKKLIEENKQLRETLEKRSQIASSISLMVGESELGTGNKIDDNKLSEPSKTETT